MSNAPSSQRIRSLQFPPSAIRHSRTYSIHGEPPTTHPFFHKPFAPQATTPFPTHALHDFFRNSAPPELAPAQIALVPSGLSLPTATTHMHTAGPPNFRQLYLCAIKVRKRRCFQLLFCTNKVVENLAAPNIWRVRQIFGGPAKYLAGVPVFGANLGSGKYLAGSPNSCWARHMFGVDDLAGMHAIGGAAGRNPESLPGKQGGAGLGWGRRNVGEL